MSLETIAERRDRLMVQAWRADYGRRRREFWAGKAASATDETSNITERRGAGRPWLAPR